MINMRAAAARVRDQLDKLVRSAAYQKALQEPIVTIRSTMKPTDQPAMEALAEAMLA